MPSRFCIHYYVRKPGRPSSGHRTGHGQSLFQFPRRVEPKNVLTIRQLLSSPRLVSSIQFSSVTQSYSTLFDPIDCSTPGLPVHHQLLEFTQIHVHWISDAIQPSYPLSSPSPPTFNPSQHQGLFKWVNSASGGQSIGVSASASVLPMNIQDWFPLGWTGWISLQSKGLSRVFSNTTVQKHQFFGAQPSSQSNSHIDTWLLEKP